MRLWTTRLLFVAASLLLTGCLWGPGKFASDLTLRKNGSFVLDYRGEIVMQLPKDDGDVPAPWSASMAHCYVDMIAPAPDRSTDGLPKQRPCTAAEIADQKSQYDERAAGKRTQSEQMAKALGLPGLDDESNRAFAVKLMKQVGWRSVTYRGKGIFDVDYHFEGSARQDFLFPALPDNDLIIPFIAIRRRSDGSVLVTAPAFTGGSGPLAARAGDAAAAAGNGGPPSRAQGRFTIITDGEILTNNSEDGPAAHALGRQLHWDVDQASNKIPETLIRL